MRYACTEGSAILCASKNHSECIDVLPHVLHLPVGETSIEPSTVKTQSLEKVD